MAQVATVRGPVDTADLGPTLMHEHVFVLNTEYIQNADWWDEDQQVADAVQKLQALKDRGVDTIVDPTVLGLGRYIPRVQRVNEQVDLNIIVATGIYTYDELPHQYTNRGPGLLLDVPEPMVVEFTRDINDGIPGTGVHAAFLKCAVEVAGLTPGVERVLRAVGQTHLDTGRPITVHTQSATQAGKLVVQVYREMGVDLAKVVIGHAGDSNDLDYLKELADAGCQLGMDRFGLDIYNPTEQRVATIATLAEQGYADRIVLAHDASCFIDWFGPDLPQLLETMAPNWNFTHISDDVLPALRKAGVTDEQIEQMMVQNPRRYFE